MSEGAADAEASALSLSVLGALEVRSGGRTLALPRSKKTRALLGYLSVERRRHQRTALCELFWDSTDDPRAALRWSLSKLRSVVNEDGESLRADRESVELDAAIDSDFEALSSLLESSLQAAPLELLTEAAGRVRGELLEGLDLPDQFDYQAWVVAQRERAREARCAILGELVRRLAERPPQEALPYARELAQADPLSVAARLDLLRLLCRADKLQEAAQQFDIAERLFRELEAPGLAELREAWRSIARTPAAATPVEEPAPIVTEATQLQTEERPWVGREAELQLVDRVLEQVTSGGAQVVLTITGEAGVGKSRLAAEVARRSGARSLRVLRGRAYEAESTRPFGLWSDALASDGGPQPLDSGEAVGPATREELFRAFADAVRERTAKTGLVLMLDDVQWMDRDSAELLHYLARSTRDRPVLLVLLARPGELEDNEPVQRSLAGVRRESGLETIELEPLSREEIAELVNACSACDADAVYDASGGNPLYALELARAGFQAGGSATSSIEQLVRERVNQLPASSAEVLRWGAVLGHSVGIERLQSLSSLESQELIEALERLEQHALLRADEAVSGAYRFAHDLVREAIYAQLSGPRRRLMHLQVAQLLAGDLRDSATAMEVARHAYAAGDALLAVRSCISAGQEALRLFANADAEAIARRGLELVDELDEAQRIAATLDLLRIRYSARTPDREKEAQRVLAMAERALDLGLTHEARLGFQMVSFLRWESTSLADAHENILQAERVSRLAEPEERAAALAQAARCLVLLERTLGQAEAFLLEADRTSGDGRPGGEVAFAKAMLAAHRGEHEAAVRGFREARWVGREQGDRLAEFRAIEHWTMLEVDAGRFAEAVALAGELATLGERLRRAAEGPSARALLALTRYLTDATDGLEPLAQALDELLEVDARFEHAYVASRLALGEARRGEWRACHEHSAIALESATAIGRPSDIALCHALLLCSAGAGDDSSAAAEHETRLEELRRGDLSASVQSSIDSFLSGAETPIQA